MYPILILTYAICLQCCIGLSYILKRDIDLDKFIIEQTDRHFFKMCFKLLDFLGESALTRFPMYKIISSALMTNSAETNELLDLIWTTVKPEDEEMRSMILFDRFSEALEVKRSTHLNHRKYAVT